MLMLSVANSVDETTHRLAVLSCFTLEGWNKTHTQTHA